MATLDQWFGGRDLIRRLYQEELGRDIVGDPDALTNWLYHWREGLHDEAWIRARIRESPEWLARQGTEDAGTPVPVDPGPPPPVISTPAPAGGGGRRVLRVTDERDGELLNRGYGYWSQVWIGRDGIRYVFTGHSDGRPRFYTVRPDGAVMRLGSYGFPYGGTAEGWAWTPDGWIMLCEGPRLRRVDPFTGEDRVVFDISETHPSCDLWQSHSSDDGTTHCATVRQIVSDGAYPKVGTVVFRHGQQTFFPAQGVLDESALAGTDWLIIKEDDDNRIIHLDTRQTRLVRDGERAVGHSDCGPDFIVGEADKPDPGACVYWDLRTWKMRLLFPTLNMGHVSVRAGRCLLSGPQSLSLVPLDGSRAPEHLIDHGMVGSDYDHQVQANLDHTGTVACYLSNHGGGQLDLFLLEL